MPHLLFLHLFLGLLLISLFPPFLEGLRFRRRRRRRRRLFVGVIRRGILGLKSVFGGQEFVEQLGLVVFVFIVFGTAHTTVFTRLKRQARRKGR